MSSCMPWKSKMREKLLSPECKHRLPIIYNHMFFVSISTWNQQQLLSLGDTFEDIDQVDLFSIISRNSW